MPGGFLCGFECRAFGSRSDNLSRTRVCSLVWFVGSMLSGLAQRCVSCDLWWFFVAYFLLRTLPGIFYVYMLSYYLIYFMYICFHTLCIYGICYLYMLYMVYVIYICFHALCIYGFALCIYGICLLHILYAYT